MNGYVEAVSDLIQDAADFAHDVRSSETSNLRLGLLLQDDEFARGLANADLKADDVSSMSASSWVWYLLWRSSRAPAPSIAFLDALFDKSTNPMIRRGIVESVLDSIEPENSDGQKLTDDSPRNWISWRFTSVTRLDTHANEPARESQEDRNARVLELASYLLEIGTERSIMEIRRMLRSSWPGRDRLVALAYEQVSDLDDRDEARIKWLRQLGVEGSQGYDFPPFGPEGT